MKMKKLALAFAAFALAASSALAAGSDVLAPAAGRTIDLGSVNGVAYYTVQKDGFHVVATLAYASTQPIRFEAVLTPGQAVILSSPNNYGEAPAKVQISRNADGVRVEPLPMTN